MWVCVERGSDFRTQTCLPTRGCAVRGGCLRWQDSRARALSHTDTHAHALSLTDTHAHALSLTDTHAHAQLRMIRVVKPLRWFKLARIVKLAKGGFVMNLLMDYFNISPKASQTVKVLVMLIMTIHIIACTWWLWKVCTQIKANARTHARTHARTYKHACMHAHTHTRTHTHAHTHTNTHV